MHRLLHRSKWCVKTACRFTLMHPINFIWTKTKVININHSKLLSITRKINEYVIIKHLKSRQCGKKCIESETAMSHSYINIYYCNKSKVKTYYMKRNRKRERERMKWERENNSRGHDDLLLTTAGLKKNKNVKNKE